MKYEDIYLPPNKTKALRQTTAELVENFKATGGVVQVIEAGKSGEEAAFEAMKADYRAGRPINNPAMRRTLFRVCAIEDALDAYKQEGAQGLLRCVLTLNPERWSRWSLENYALRAALLDCGFVYMSGKQQRGTQFFKFQGKEYKVG